VSFNSLGSKIENLKWIGNMGVNNNSSGGNASTGSPAPNSNHNVIPVVNSKVQLINIANLNVSGTSVT